MSMSRAPCRLSRALVVATLCLPLTAVAGPKEDAQGHIAKAMEAHGKNDFQTALTELQAAYAADPLPDLLYAIGQVHVKLEQCGEAITSYENYLATSPAAQATADTQQAIDTCKAKLPPPPPPPPEVIAPPPPAPSMTPAWYTDKLGGGLVLGGVVAGVVGLVLYTGAREDLDVAEGATSLAQYDDLVDSAGTKRTFAVVIGVGSAALLGAGVVRYMMVRGKANPEARGVSVVPTRDGGLVTFGGVF